MPYVVVSEREQHKILQKSALLGHNLDKSSPFLPSKIPIGIFLVWQSQNPQKIPEREIRLVRFTILANNFPNGKEDKP